MDFLKSFLGSLAGVVVAGVVLILIFFSMIAGAIADLDFSSQQKPKIEENSVLHVTLTQEIVDRAQHSPFDNFNFGNFKASNPMGMNDIIESIEKASEDENIEGIYLDMSFTRSGFATMQEVRAALEEFKSSGKWIIAYSESMAQGAYWMSTVADSIYLYPMGGIQISGLRTELMFFEGTLEKLGVETTIIRGPDNIYKSAVEPFTSKEMSDPNREQIQAFLDALWGEMVADIAESRGMTEDEVNETADKLALLGAGAGKNAVALGYIDGLKYTDEMDAILRSKLGVDDPTEELEMVSMRKYINSNSNPFDFAALREAAEKAKEEKEEAEEEGKEAANDQNHIAVIYARGGIGSGEGSEEEIGSDRIAGAIREARLDSTVKAVVLRVNSPGGSALASDVIWREVVLCKEAKPFVVSMGDVAASGGYYISCAADKIFAQPTTITGSIGVFGMLMNSDKFLEDKLGITVDRAKTNEMADVGSGTRKMTDEELAIIQTSVDEIYYDFIAKVADGRGMTTDEVNQVGRGRVWAGTDALRIGLVDELGGLDDAIAAAQEMASLEEGDYELMELPKLEDPMQQFFKELSGEAAVQAWVEAEFGQTYSQYHQIREFSKMEGIQMRLPFIIEVK